VGDQKDSDRDMNPTGRESVGVSRRAFLHGVIAVSAATRVAASPTRTSAFAATTPAPVTSALTAEQTAALTTVLNRIVPAEGVMPAAGTLGIAGIIDQALAVAPHLRRHIVSLLSALPAADEFRMWPDDVLDRRLQEVEEAQPEAFDLLLQATYTGYYSAPRVLEALGGVESDRQGELRLDCFDPRA
jgi:hypothetical protein